MKNQHGTAGVTNASGTKYQEHYPKLNNENTGYRKLLEPVRKLVHVPTYPGWKRLGFIMLIERCEIIPGGVLTDYLDQPGGKNNTKQQKPK